MREGGKNPRHIKIHTQKALFRRAEAESGVGDLFDRQEFHFPI
jgi:hypothetical protein